MKKNITYLVFLLFFVSYVPASAGGPWLHKKNKGFAQFQSIIPAYAYSSLLMGEFINDKQATNRTVFNSDYIIYAEYGLTDKLNVIANIPLKYVSTGNITDNADLSKVLPKGNLAGLNNPEISFKYALLDKHVKMAISINASLNTISQDISKGLATGYDANSIGATAHIGRSSSKQYGFLEVGFHKFTNNFSDIIKVRLEHGWQIKKPLNVGLVFDGRFSLKNGTYFNENLAQTGLYPNDQEYAAISAKTAYEKENGLGFSFAIPVAPIYFKYIGFNGTFSFGVYKKF